MQAKINEFRVLCSNLISIVNANYFVLIAFYRVDMPNIMKLKKKKSREIITNYCN